MAVVIDADVATNGDGFRVAHVIALAGVHDDAKRPEGNENPELPSGDVEVVVSSYDVLSASEPLPFPIDGHTDVSEERRLR